MNPRNVVVNQDVELIDWWVKDPPQCWTSADATLEHAVTREMADQDVSTGLAGTFRFELASNRLGEYQVVGAAWCDEPGAEQPVRIRKRYLTIKAANRVALAASRRGSYVTLKAVSRRYGGGDPVWVPNRGAGVSFQRKIDGAWRQVGTATANRSGVAKVTVQRSAVSAYRAVVSPTAITWNRTSGTVRK